MTLQPLALCLVSLGRQKELCCQRTTTMPLSHKFSPPWPPQSPFQVSQGAPGVPGHWKLHLTTKEDPGRGCPRWDDIIGLHRCHRSLIGRKEEKGPNPTICVAQSLGASYKRFWCQSHGLSYSPTAVPLLSPWGKGPGSGPLSNSSGSSAPSLPKMLPANAFAHPIF